MGDLGKERRKLDVEPVPEHTPAPQPEKEPTPA